MSDASQYKQQVVDYYDKRAATYERDEYVVDTSPEHILQRYAPLYDAFRNLNPRNIIELGGGTGIFSMALAACLPESDITVVDLSKGMLAELNAKIRSSKTTNCHTKQCDFNELPFEDEAFDAALFSYVLHETPDPRASIREAQRVLRKRGMLFILEIGGGAQRTASGQTLDELKRVPQSTHVHYAEPREWKEMLKRAGFVRVRDIPIRSYVRHEREYKRMEVPIYVVAGEKR